MQYVTGTLGGYLILIAAAQAELLARDWAALRAATPTAGLAMNPSAEVRALLARHPDRHERLLTPAVTTGQVPGHPLRLMRQNPALNGEGQDVDTPFFPQARLIPEQERDRLEQRHGATRNQDLINRATGLT